jgi:hypothetical protein
MRTTTRKYLRTEDIYYDGISWGTPIGQIRFSWINNDTAIEIYHDDQLIKVIYGTTINYLAQARLFVNRMIGAYLK